MHNSLEVSSDSLQKRMWKPLQQAFAIRYVKTCGYLLWQISSFVYLLTDREWLLWLFFFHFNCFYAVFILALWFCALHPRATSAGCGRLFLFLNWHTVKLPFWCAGLWILILAEICVTTATIKIQNSPSSRNTPSRCPLWATASANSRQPLTYSLFKKAQNEIMRHVTPFPPLFIVVNTQDKTLTTFKCTFYWYEIRLYWSSLCGSAVTTPTRIHEDAGSIPGLAQWVNKDLTLPWAMV